MNHSKLKRLQISACWCIVSSCNKHLWHSVTNSSVNHHLKHALWVVMHDLEMFLAKQYFDDWLVSIKQQDRSFPRTEKQNLNQSKHINCFTFTWSSNIFSIRSDNNAQITTFCQEQIENYFGNFWPGSRKVNSLLRNVESNNNSTQNQNEFQPSARNLLGISSVNIKFSNQFIP